MKFNSVLLVRSETHFISYLNQAMKSSDFYEKQTLNAVIFVMAQQFTECSLTGLLKIKSFCFYPNWG